MNKRMSERLASLVALALAGITGCAAELDVEPKAETKKQAAAICEGVEEGLDVDLLFVIDNSHSMADEQASLAREIPRMVRSLAQGELISDASKGRVERFIPARSIHVGVVTSDLGLSGVDPSNIHVMSCREPNQDGLLRKADDCGAGSGFIAYDPSDADVDEDAVSENLACLAQVGTEGCGVEQPLEAMWKALAPAADLSFSMSTGGHGDAEHAAFLRDNSLLVVVVLSDEDDCSMPDISSTLLTQGDHSDLNVRCGNNPDSLHPISRYALGLRSLRADAPDRFLFAAVAGLPVDLEGSDPDTILAAEAMQFVEDHSDPDFVIPRPACQTATSIAYPARRMVTLAKELGDQALVRSICRDDFGTAMTSLSSAMGKRMERSRLACE